MMEKPVLSLPTKPFHIRGGVKLRHNKNTSGFHSEMLPCPKEVVLPMVQHIGMPCRPVVKAGMRVCVGNVVGVNESLFSAPIHASVSGIVKGITRLQMPGGSVCDAVIIESDGKMKMSASIKPPIVESVDDFLDAVNVSGLVGLGGAGFPTHVKINVPEGKNVDTLIINCAECEPYITTDNREAIENTDNVINGIVLVMRMLKLERAVIGIENNKPEAIKVLKNALSVCKDKEAERICVLTLKSRYPQGAEKVIVKAVTGRVVPVGKLPIDTGCIVMNITSVGFISSYIRTGIPLISKRITVDGSAVTEPKNVIVPIGTPIKDVIEFCGGYKGKCLKLISGGPMMGTALESDDFPILKQNNAVLAFDEKDAALHRATDCIRCGRCAASCPFSLMPASIEKAVKMRDKDKLKKLGVTDCMECGSCAYNCPAHRPLVQIIHQGKQILTHNRKKQGV